MSGRVITLDVSRKPSGKTPPRVARSRRATPILIALEYGRARNALGLCARCQLYLREQAQVFVVPLLHLVFCVLCGFSWREQLQHMAKDKDQ